MRLLQLLLALLGMTVVGCRPLAEAVERTRDRLDPASKGRIQTFPAAARVVHEAARVAAMEMGYRIERSGAAQGLLDAVGRIESGAVSRRSRQLYLRVRLRPVAEGTEVNVRITEVIEDDSTGRPGQATEAALRDTPQYQSFFRRIEELLASP